MSRDDKRFGPALWLGLALAAAAALPTGPAGAATRTVRPGGGDLAAALAAAAPGDRLILAPGVYHGPVVIERALSIEGRPGAVVDGGGRGQVITVSAAHAVVRGLIVRNSGRDLAAMDAGIYLDAGAADALVENNRLEGNLFGVYLQGAPRAVVRGNDIIGRTDFRMSERGNGVSLWNSPGAQVVDNSFRYGRDGIFVNTSRRNLFRGNRFRDLRFAIHYMYADDSEVSDNLSIGNHVGFALMFSHRLKVYRNLSEGDRDHGLLLNYTNNSIIEGNVVHRGEKKCAFIYNSSKNKIRDNYFEGCQIGIHFTGGSAHNVVAGNAFVGNRRQVKYVGTRWLEWSENGRGNYWSDNPAFDLDGDGIADAAFRPNDLVDHVLWRYPLAKLLVSSPALQLLRWAQSQFPALHPGGIVDSAPLMAPPDLAAANGRAERS